MKKLLLVTFCMSFSFASASSVLGFQSVNGVGQLRNLIGTENANGSGVDLLQVEAVRVLRDTNDIDNDGDTREILERYYGPHTTNGQFDGKTFQVFGDPPSDGPSSHASGVGFDLYGNSLGAAGGIGDSGSPPISITSASNFINNSLINGGGTPDVFTHNVSNHSYIADLDDENSTSENPFFEEDAVEVLRRLDYSINEGNMTTVVGTSNGATAELPALFVQSYNTINVGRADGSHASGLTTLNGTGRNAIHLVTNETTTSGATAVVSGLASILHQTGSPITSATNQEVIKATLLAGATKDIIPGDWDNSSPQPLDEVFGAGQANIFNSYLIQQAGEMNGTAAGGVLSPTTDFNGWDYGIDFETEDELFYEFLVDSNTRLEELSIALTWNIGIEDGTPNSFSFNPESELANLSLELFDSTGAIYEFSDSSVDNIEHLYFDTLSEGTYRLRVFNNSSENVSTDFALAFRSSVVSAVPEPCSSTLLIG
ncbi:hypothetical protein N9Y42_10665, partial [Mariniblastus sp.]|nr:hypothetical protein [Mariniblastus sp.]